jgi:hypothetical protein
MHGIVVMAKPKEMQPQRQAEAQHRSQATSTAAVKNIVTRDGDDPHTRDAGLVAGWPMPGGQIRHLMAVTR